MNSPFIKGIEDSYNTNIVNIINGLELYEKQIKVVLKDIIEKCFNSSKKSFKDIIEGWKDE